MISNKSFRWLGADVLEKIKAEERKRMITATIYLANQVKLLLGKKVGRVGKVVVERSKEGEPPRLETSELRRSIAKEIVADGDQIVGRCGTNKRYAKYLELPSFLNRPFLATALRTSRNTIARILIGQKIT